MEECGKVKSAFRVESVTRNRYGGEGVEFTAIHDTYEKDLKPFAEATPTGNIKIYISNKALHGYFQPGDIHFVTFEKRPSPVPVAETVSDSNL